MFQGLIDTVVDFRRDVLRNIPSILFSEALLDDLSSDPRERAFGEVLVAEQKDPENLVPPIILRPFIYGVGVDDAHKCFPTRFSDGRRFGMWYGSLDLLTTVYESAYHFRNRLDNMLTDIREEVVSERRVFRVHVSGILVDLRGKHHKFPHLLDKRNYSFTHSVGSYLYDKGQSGLLIESAHYQEGINVAAFKPGILSNPRHLGYLVYRWLPGDSKIRIEKTPGRTWRVIPV